MARIALDKMSRNELLELQTDVAEAIKRREAEDRAAVKAEMIALAAKHGLSIDEILGKGAGRSKGTVPAKYRNPDNASETWTGRGRQPRWLVAYLKKGGKLEKCVIK